MHIDYTVYVTDYYGDKKAKHTNPTGHVHKLHALFSDQCPRTTVKFTVARYGAALNLCSLPQVLKKVPDMQVAFRALFLLIGFFVFLTKTLTF